MASQQGGRGSNLSQEDRRKDGEQSQKNQNAGQKGHKLSQEDRRKGGEQSHNSRR